MRRRAVNWILCGAFCFGGVGLGASGVGVASAEEPAASDKALDKALEEALARSITLRLEDTRLADALDFIEQIAGLNIARDPGVSPDIRVTMQLKDISTRNALKLLVQSAGDCSFETWRGCVYVRPKTFPVPRPKAPELTDAARAILGRRITLSFDRVALSEVAAFLKDVTGQPFAAARSAARRSVTLRARNLTVGEALDVVCRLARVRVVKGADGGMVFDE